MSIGWLGNAFVIAGLWFLSPHSRWPFLATAVGELIWAVRSWQIGQPDMLLICVLFAGLALRNYWRWDR